MAGAFVIIENHHERMLLFIMCIQVNSWHDIYISTLLRCGGEVPNDKFEQDEELDGKLTRTRQEQRKFIDV